MTISVAVISIFVLFQLFKKLNESKLKTFVSIQELIIKSKYKKLYNNITLIAVLIILHVLHNYFKLDDIWFGLLLGFSLALRKIIFDTQCIED